MTRRTIIMVTPYYPPAGGGLERYADKVAQGLTASGDWRVIVITSGGRGWSKMTVEDHGDVLVYRLPHQLKLSNVPFGLTWSHQLRRLFTAIKPDLINVHAPVPGLADLAVRAAGSTPVVVTYHSTTMVKPRHWANLLATAYERYLLPSMLNQADHVVTSSSYISRQFIKSLTAASTTVITPGVDHSQFTASETPIEPNLLFVGSLEAGSGHKGLDDLLAAMPLIRESIPAAKLTVVGGGHMLGHYQDLAASLGLGSAVSFAGASSSDQVAAAYQQARLVMVPSRVEGFGMTALEAMSSGRAVIATNIGGLPDVVDDDVSGRLVPANNPVALANAAVELLSNKKLLARLAATGFERAQVFNWESRIQATGRLFGRVIQDAKAPRLLLVTPYFAPQIGGLERYAYQLSQQLVARGWNVIVATANHAGHRGVVEQRYGLLIHRLPVWLRISNTPLNPLWPLYLRRLIRRWRPNLINAHTPVVGLVDAAALAAGKTPLVVTYHAASLYKQGFSAFNLVIGAYHAVQRLTLRRADRIIAVSPYVKQQLGERVAAKTVVIPNAIAQTEIITDTRHPQAGQLLFLGNLDATHRWKGLESIMDAVAIERAAGGKSTLVVGGEGNYRSRYEDYAAKLGLTDQVTFVGAVTGAAKAQLLNQATALITYPTTSNDAFPTVLLEGWGAGLPVIAAGIGPLPSLIEHDENGFLVPPHDTAALAEAIVTVLGSKARQKRLAAGGKELARSLTWDIQGHRTDQFMRGLV